MYSINIDESFFSSIILTNNFVTGVEIKLSLFKLIM